MRKRVLCVDDVSSNLDLIQKVVENLDRYEVSVARNAAQALAQAQAQAPDLVLIDIRLPGTDGFGLLAQLRALPELSHCQYISVSADVTLANHQQSQAAGFVHHIDKPYALAHVQSLILQVLD